jgi:hypothetical protein
MRASARRRSAYNATRWFVRYRGAALRRPRSYRFRVRQQPSIRITQRDQLHARAGRGRQRHHGRASQAHRRGVTQDRGARCSVIRANRKFVQRSARRKEEIELAQLRFCTLTEPQVPRAK